jgi:hypothetical protein
MTLHCFDKATNKSVKWVALPLEFVDWMAAHFNGTLIRYLRQVDPYARVHIPETALSDAVNEFKHVRERLKGTGPLNLPKTVDLFGAYGRAGALRTAEQLIEFFEFAAAFDGKIVSIGD